MLKKIGYNQRVLPKVTQEDHKELVQYKNSRGRVTTVTRAFALMAQFKGEGEIIEKAVVKKKEPKKESKTDS